MPKHSIVIGNYPLRGNAQICRLLCEYLKVKLANGKNKDKLKNYALNSCPTCRKKFFRTAGSIPMCFYIIDRFSNG